MTTYGLTRPLYPTAGLLGTVTNAKSCHRSGGSGDRIKGSCDGTWRISSRAYGTSFEQVYDVLNAFSKVITEAEPEQQKDLLHTIAVNQKGGKMKEQLSSKRKSQ